jgi:hypothetical protein
MAWGTTGTGDGEFSGTNGVAVDGDDNVFVSDSSPRIQKFTNDGVFITSWGSAGAGDGQFNFPRGLSTDDNGNVYVADRNLPRMQKFTGTGAFLTKWGSFGSGEGQFNLPYAIRAGANGVVYVSDSSNFRVQKFAFSAEVGRWDGPYDWPVTAIHAFTLPTGKVLHYAFPGAIQNPSAYIWDPVTWEFTPVPVNRPLFCSGHSFMADGRLLVTGGNGPAPEGEFHGITDTHIFDAFDQTWARVADIADGRWYPTNVTLADGGVLVLSGLDQTGATNFDVEVYQPGTGTCWNIVAQAGLPLYPWTHLLSSGDVLYSGPSRETGILSTDTWSWYGIVLSNDGWRSGGMSVLLPGERDRVMIIGGQRAGLVTATAEIIDCAVPSPAWHYTQPMNFPRMHANAVILPDGNVLVIGGHSAMHEEGPGGPPPSSVYEAEVFDPRTETWSVMAAMQRPRVYHSTAVLLPDGSVLAAGSDG